jgi:hypothetical protein
MPQGYLFTFGAWRFTLPLSVFGWPDRDFDLDSPVPVALGLGSCALYAALVFLWSRVVGSVKPSSGDRIGFSHHASLFLYSLAAFSAALYHHISSGEYASFTAFSCTPVPGWLRLVSLSFTASKIWEWGDTLVLLLRGESWRRIGFLHLYHHCTTFFLFLCVINFAGPEKAGMLLNGFVHTIMYAHFAWRLPKPLRPLITAAQIVQLVFVIWLWFVMPSTCPEYEDFPSRFPAEFLFPVATCPVYVLFFLKFFADTYLFRKPKPGKQKGG